MSLGARVVSVDAPDPWFLKKGTRGSRACGRVDRSDGYSARIASANLLLLDFNDESGEVGTLGLRFGMTGRLIVGDDSRY